MNQSQKKVKLAKKGYLPDFSLGVAYSQRDELQTGGTGVDFISGMFSLNLPIYFWKKQKKEVEENKLNEISILFRYENVRQQIYKELDQTLSDLKKNQQRIKLYQAGIIPQGSRALQSALSAYQVDKVDFLTLVSNQMTLFNDQLEYYKALSDYHKNLALLELLIGVELNHIIEK